MLWWTPLLAMVVTLFGYQKLLVLKAACMPSTRRYSTLMVVLSYAPSLEARKWQLQENALAGTAARIRANISSENMPSMHFHHCCHSLMQVSFLVGNYLHLL